MSPVQMEALDFRYLLLEYYKKLHISENELAVILMVDHLLEQKNNLITADLLALKMNLSTKELDAILVKLIEKNYLEFKVTKKMKVSLKPLKNRLYEAFQTTLAEEQATESSNTKMAYLSNIYEVFEKTMNRTLSPLEVSTINEWVTLGHSDESIISAMREALSKGKRSFRSIDKILLQYQARDDIEKTGYSAVSESWTSDMEKTLEIAKANWIKDED